jgi:hypothetical protein
MSLLDPPHNCSLYAALQATSGIVTNDGEDEEPVVPLVPIEACIARFAGDSVLPDYYSPALGDKGRAVQTYRMASFPPYLMVHMQKCAPLPTLSALGIGSVQLHGIYNTVGEVLVRHYLICSNGSAIRVLTRADSSWTKRCRRRSWRHWWACSTRSI